MNTPALTRDWLATSVLVLAALALLVLGGAQSLASDQPPRESVWTGPDTPLARQLISFFRSSKPFDVEDALSRLDTENGFAILYEDAEEVLSDPDAIRRGLPVIAERLAGWYSVNEILDIKELGSDYVSLITSTRAVQYMTTRRPYYYVHFRSVFVLRRDGDSFKTVYQVEAPLSPITYLWKFHVDGAKSFLQEQGAELWLDPDRMDPSK